MREVFLVPSSQDTVQLLFGELFMAVVFHISFSAAIGLLQGQAYQDTGTMTVFTKLLDCTDLGHITDHILSILQGHLQSESLLLWRMAITCFITLSQRPERAATLQGLLSEVTQQLQDENCNTRTAALTVLGNTLCLADRQTAILVALQLVQMLLPLFENIRDEMEVAVSTHKAQMRKDMQKSLMPLFFHLHDKDHSVAQLMEDSIRVEDYLHQSLPYLQSPQEPLCEAAIRRLPRRC
ncbi:hypothetical protein AV530_012160 [Patagioenas fasciata monilis]|uniref:Maestro/Maestro-like HEAT-repeats domain-containing protein n=1 Tax=Patagioenas fasciata monilis TaxID=372326 RepID=A0A1V4K373_PATFA|nr:hypothetical protein AV530_012160 [Patagioenas fasciata monilis]